jgi:hypothetical protein
MRNGKSEANGKNMNEFTPDFERTHVQSPTTIAL